MANTFPTKCPRCGEGNEPRMSNCAFCGSMLSLPTTRSLAQNTARSVTSKTMQQDDMTQDSTYSLDGAMQGSSGLIDEDMQALMHYAELAQMSPMAISIAPRATASYQPSTQVSPRQAPSQFAPSQYSPLQRASSQSAILPKSAQRHPITLAMQFGGGSVFLLGAFLWGSNVFGFYPTIPFLSYMMMLSGGFTCRAGFQK